MPTASVVDSGRRRRGDRGAGRARRRPARQLPPRSASRWGLPTLWRKHIHVIEQVFLTRVGWDMLGHAGHRTATKRGVACGRETIAVHGAGGRPKLRTMGEAWRRGLGGESETQTFCPSRLGLARRLPKPPTELVRNLHCAGESVGGPAGGFREYLGCGERQVLSRTTNETTEIATQYTHSFLERTWCRVALPSMLVGEFDV